MRQNALSLITRKIFDYAGMFPPASLDLATALQAYNEFDKKLTHPSLASRLFVVDLPHFKTLLSLPNQQNIPVAVLGSPANSLLDLASDTRKQEVSLITNHNVQKNTPAARIASYEIRSNAALSEDAEVLVEALRPITSALQKAEISFAFEPDLSTPSWKETLTSTTAALHLLAKEYGLPRAKLKFRGIGSAGSGTTGIGPERIARVIKEAVAQGIQLKATAGLHHPIIEKERYGNQLGFINLLVAHLLHRSSPQQFTEEAMKQCLGSTALTDFDFNAGVRFREFGISLFEAEEVLENFPLIIGSCSLDEPDQDLTRLFGG